MKTVKQAHKEVIEKQQKLKDTYQLPMYQEIIDINGGIRHNELINFIISKHCIIELTSKIALNFGQQKLKTLVGIVNDKTIDIIKQMVDYTKVYKSFKQSTNYIISLEHFEKLGFKDIIDIIKKEKIKVILIYKSELLGIRAKTLYSTLKDICKQHNVVIICVETMTTMKQVKKQNRKIARYIDELWVSNGEQFGISTCKKDKTIDLYFGCGYEFAVAETTKNNQLFYNILKMLLSKYEQLKEHLEDSQAQEEIEQTIKKYESLLIESCGSNKARLDFFKHYLDIKGDTYNAMSDSLDERIKQLDEELEHVQPDSNSIMWVRKW